MVLGPHRNTSSTQLASRAISRSHKARTSGSSLAFLVIPVHGVNGRSNNPPEERRFTRRRSEGLPSRTIDSDNNREPDGAAIRARSSTSLRCAVRRSLAPRSMLAICDARVLS